MIYVYAFLVGGALCALAQYLYETTKLTPAHVIVGYVMAGAILGGLGLYQPLLDFAGGGALIPVSGFGNAIVTGILDETARFGWEGFFTGAFELTGLGLAAAILFAFLASILARPQH
ncbi:MAG TPA: SpoVA/SpoVAEb family sporulation membrane protein [Limnochordia bacterium]|nr:SpoVA/SpoVAEb family sporulation membrane protein [Limnochordia bacterium]